MRIVTRGDFDGLTCTVLLSLLEKIDQIRLVHPKDAQDGKIGVDEQDIIVNIPFILGCRMWFDHHSSEAYVGRDISFKGRFEIAPSCARVIYNHYAPAHREKLARFLPLIEATDRFDGAELSSEDVLQPKGYILLAQTIDPRTGFSDEFQPYFEYVAKLLQDAPLDTVLADPVVVKRSSRVLNEQAAFIELLRTHVRVENKVIISDLRGIKDKPVGNRFVVFTLFPQGNVDVRLIDGKDGTVVVAVGHSIFTRTCTVNIGRLLAEYGGGGHKSVGAAQLHADTADEKIAEIVKRLKS